MQSKGMLHPHWTASNEKIRKTISSERPSIQVLNARPLGRHRFLGFFERHSCSQITLIPFRPACSPTRPRGRRSTSTFFPACWGSPKAVRNWVGERTTPGPKAYNWGWIVKTISSAERNKAACTTTSEHNSPPTSEHQLLCGGSHVVSDTA